MRSPNAETIAALYDAFGRGDINAVIASMSPAIVWNEAENFPYADRNPYVGPIAIVEGVFGRCAAEWDGFAVALEEIIDAGETVVALGRYKGVYKATGRAQNTQFAHVWRFQAGKIAQFQQYADTKQAAKVTGAI